MSSNEANKDPQNQLPQQGYSNTLPEIDAVDPYGEAKKSRDMLRQSGSGRTRGEHVIDGTMVVRDGDTDGRIIMGIYGDEFGIFGGTIENGDENNLTIGWKIIGATRYIYKDGYNVLQDGILPDGGGGFVIVKEGNNVADVFA